MDKDIDEGIGEDSLTEDVDDFTEDNESSDIDKELDAL